MDTFTPTEKKFLIEALEGLVLRGNRQALLQTMEIQDSILRKLKADVPAEPQATEKKPTRKR